MKKYAHSRQYGKRVTNPYTLIFSVVILCIWLVGENNHYDNVYQREPDVFLKPVIVDHPEDESIETKIRKYFPRNGNTMIAIAHAESQMNPNAIGYNCYYYQGKATTTPIKGGSMSCRPEDRKLAWSRDCGLLQLNTTSKVCPKETIDEHLKRAADLSRKQGLSAWVTYQRGMHLTQK